MSGMLIPSDDYGVCETCKHDKECHDGKPRCDCLMCSDADRRARGVIDTKDHGLCPDCGAFSVGRHSVTNMPVLERLSNSWIVLIL